MTSSVVSMSFCHFVCLGSRLWKRVDFILNVYISEPLKPTDQPSTIYQYLSYIAHKAISKPFSPLALKHHEQRRGLRSTVHDTFVSSFQPNLHAGSARKPGMWMRDRMCVLAFLEGFARTGDWLRTYLVVELSCWILKDGGEWDWRF